MKKLTALVVLLTVIGTASFASSGPLGKNSNFKVVAKSDTKYELIYVSAEESNVKISIYDAEGKNIDNNTVQDVTKFRRTFDFSKLEAGKYSIVVKNSEGTAREEIDHLPYKMKLKTFVTKVPDSQSLKLHVGDFNKNEPVRVSIYNANNKIVHKDVITNAKAFSKVYNMSKAKSGEFRVQIENDGELKSFTYKM